MEAKEIISYIEDKDIAVDDNWYFHATKTDINSIKNILEEGIKSSYLRNQKGNHFNGKYYISLYKNIKEAEKLKLWLSKYPKFIISDISPFYASRNKFKYRQLFINTRVPFRTSEWDGEFHQYLKIEPSKIVAIEYDLSYILNNMDGNIKENLKFLKELILCLEQLNKDLPIYDMFSNREFNKKKILSLNI